MIIHQVSLSLFFCFFAFFSQAQITHQVSVLVNQSQSCPVVTSLNESELFQAFPNPASSVITVTARSKNATLLLLDLQGRIVLQKTLNNGKEHLDVQGIKEGIYLLRCTEGNQSDQIKIKIQQ